METKNKKRFWIFIAVAYGVAYAMNLIMIIGFKKNYDLTAFVNTQMMYPACGVILGKLIFRKEDEKLPMVGYITILATTALMMLCALGSIILHIDPIKIPGAGELDIWNTVSTLPLIFGSLVAYVAFWVCGKEKRENAGLQRKNILWSVILIAVFIALFFGRSIFSAFLTDLFNNNNDGWTELKEAIINKNMIIGIFVLPINFFFSWAAFFGEEYGWRYYLQPVMQDKLGKRSGVILLGVIWGLWHIGVDYMFYTTEYGTQALIAQIITCIVIAVFFGYAYMKTGNIWVPVIMHYLNNNIAGIMDGGTEPLQNQVIPWSMLPVHAISSIVFLLFIIAPLYNKKKAEKEEVQSEEN